MFRIRSQASATVSGFGSRTGLLIRHLHRIFPNLEMPLLGRRLPDPTDSGILMVKLQPTLNIITTESIYHIIDTLEVKKKLQNLHPKTWEMVISSDQ